MKRDTDPVAWPPAPQTSPVELANTVKPAHTKAEWASLILVGIGIAIALLWYQDGTARDAAKPWRPAEVKAAMEIAIPFGVLPFWSVLALICGFIGRRSIAGKIGMVVSLGALAATALAAGWLWRHYRMTIW